LGTKDSINSGPQLVGLIVKDRQVAVKLEDEGSSDERKVETPAAIKVESEDTEMTVLEPLDEDAKALQAILRGPSAEDDKPDIGIIPLPAEPLDEEAALRRDLVDLPETSTLADYARIPVEQFGAAMLRGMGWKPPAQGDDEPWVPGQRPALLGLGAKPKAVEVMANGKEKKADWKKERRYVPLVKKEREGTTEGRGSGRTSRASSRSRSPPNRRDGPAKDWEEPRRDERPRDSGRGHRGDRGHRSDRGHGSDRDDRRARDDERSSRSDREDRRPRDNERLSRSDRDSDREREKRSRDYDSRDRRR